MTKESSLLAGRSSGISQKQKRMAEQAQNQ